MYVGYSLLYATSSVSAMADRYRWVTVLRRSDTLNKKPKMRSAVHFYSSMTRSLRFSEDGIGVQPTEERKAGLSETRRHSVTETDERVQNEGKALPD